MVTKVEDSSIKFEPPRKSSLADLAYETIVEAVVGGRLPPKSRLNVDELSRQLDMSNTPIREALSRATAERLIVQQANKGYMVTPLLSEQAFHQLFEVRHLLEIHALTTADIEAADVEQLSNLVEAMSAQSHGPRYQDFKAFNRLDRAFHRLLVELSGNSFLIVAWEDLHFHLHVGRLYTGQGVIDFSSALREHAGILEAVQAQDRPMLLDRASQHITHAEQRLKPLLDNTQRSD